MQEEIDKLLNELEEKIKSLTQLAKASLLTPPGIYTFDIFVNGLLNRSVNLLKGFITLMREKNFIAAAPLVRLHLDSLLRLYAPQLIDYNIDDFSLKVIGGTPIRKLKDKDNQKMTDARLVEKISEHENFNWISKVYDTGNAYVHYSDQLIFASMKTKDVQEKIVDFTVGQHDEFIPLSEKHGAVHWMHEITDGLIFLTYSWVKQKESYTTNGG
ncbi:hypothetical protein GCM10027036_34400 [Flavihumibacter cheonanensis]|uniref:hypothetical protein n=1 Tax=Flavihumibacter cheonanensis TaxID=1442385 RepID=UPI001EF9023B|nr:hypothetical protein [Flavihumibacter cheonanensis]MCG7754821.1 hypothetical protein [Flavihumibacter cheonanensis]